MQRKTVEVILNPISQFVPGADGAVDLYLIPCYDDIASLYLTDGEWQIHYVFHDASAVEGVSRTRLWAEFVTAVRSYYGWLTNDPETRIGTHDHKP